MKKNKEIYNLKRVQITCPNCKYEFPYNKESLDKKINNIGNEIQRLSKLINKIEKIPDESRNEKELNRIKKEYSDYQKLISDLKMARETLKQEEDRTNYYNLKSIIKEFYGEKEYKRCIDEMLRRSEAYNTKDIMKLDYYSSSTGKPIKKL